MQYNILLLLVSLYISLASSFGFQVDLVPNQDECFYVNLQENEMFLISYDVIEGGDLLVDFLLFNTNNILLQETKAKKDGYYSYNATTAGDHKYCFRNQIVNKKLTFSPYIQKLPKDYSKCHHYPNTDHVENEIKKMEDYIFKIESQIYLSSSLGYTHDRVAESTDKKIYWWTIFQSLSVIGICAWQIYYLKTFFENRRVV
ncbi:hypothetical protein K502DRAFT_292024 [Neoconidiobolus thromboides FSU 785]|nr:hypothetical protein K502DRAFT_292024 [Neoconidiobolus thromboides FSU 785]